jgi:hypothetical protein
LEKGIEMALLKRHLTILLALLATFVGLALSACGGQEANKKSESGGTAPTDGQIAFRRYFEVRIQDLGYHRVKTSQILVFGGDPSSWHLHHILGRAKNAVRRWLLRASTLRSRRLRSSH